MSLQRFVEIIEGAADEFLPQLKDRFVGPQIVAWFQLHGWDIRDKDHQRSVLKQALVNLIIRRLWRKLELFPNPLGNLVPDSAVPELSGWERGKGPVVNDLGYIYTELIPQAHRRNIGQFWTDHRIAEWMTAWLLQSNPHRVLDIGCGCGNFLLKLADGVTGQNLRAELLGLDVSPILLNIAAANFAARGMARPHLLIQDYLNFEIPGDVDSVVCNPPYTRHHQIDPVVKARLQELFRQRFGVNVSRQGTMAFHFLLKIIGELSQGGRAAIIIPMEVLDARYGKTARHILCQYTKLSAVIHFSEEMNAFENVDVGACILLFTRQREEHNVVKHLTLNIFPRTSDLLHVINSDNPPPPSFGKLTLQPQRELYDIPKWFSIGREGDPQWRQTGLVVPLKEVASIMRGIATGANEFFALSSAELSRCHLENYVVRTIQRNREIQDLVLDEARWKALMQEGKHVWLLYLNGLAAERDPSLTKYIREGEQRGFSERSLVKTRKRWYLMEQRDIPPIFFTILTRGNPRFILNRAGVRPLNMFSLIYPKPAVAKQNLTELLWALLNAEFSISKLHSVSRTYGGRTLKVEPRELDNLPVVNPLSLSHVQRTTLQGIIDGYFEHGNNFSFTRKVSEFVRSVLCEGATSPPRPLRMKQLVLCESGERYKPKSVKYRRKR